MSTSTESAQLAGRASWSGKLAFVLSAAASAVGLGAMWRFPYLAAKYGGGMFLFVYLVLVFTIGKGHANTVTVHNAELLLVIGCNEPDAVLGVPDVPIQVISLVAVDVEIVLASVGV